MGIFLDSLVAALAVMGTFLLIKVLISFVEYPIRKQADVWLCVTLRVKGHGGTMASTLKKLMRFRRYAEFDLVIENRGLDSDGLRRAEILAEQAHIPLTEHRKE